MDAESLRGHCASLRGATAEYPFGPGPRVYKVVNKMFAIIPDDPPLTVSLKCDPGLAEILRATYTAVRPGYHLDHRHWNTVSVDGSIPDQEILDFVNHSYALVVSGLPRSKRP